MEDLEILLKEKSEVILGKMGIEVSASVSSSADQTVLELQAKDEQDVPFLIGFHGQTLNALQAVLGILAIKERGEYSPFLVEAGGYRRQREEELRRRALEAADKARFLLKEVSFPVMPPLERRIVHMTLAEEKGVRTESRGTGPERHIVVIPGDEGEKKR